MLKVGNKPLIMAHAGGKAHGPENSVDAVEASLARGAEIIEVDVRKSREGKLYCYHGPFGLAEIYRFESWERINALLGVNSLEEIVDVVRDRAVIFLDIKEIGVTAADIDAVCSGVRDNTWVAAMDMDWFELGDGPRLKGKYRRVKNLPGLGFERMYKRAWSLGLDAIKLLPWQATDENVWKLTHARLGHMIEPILGSGPGYVNKVKQLGSLWYSVDDLDKVPEWMSDVENARGNKKASAVPMQRF